MRFCDHNFHTVRQTEKPTPHAIVVCAYCGEVRYLYADGKVDIYRAKEYAVKNYARNGDTKTNEE